MSARLMIFRYLELMKNYESCYKSYDIRSVYDEPMDSTFTYSLGRGMGKHLMESIWKDATFVFGADVREANNELIYWFLKGLEEEWITNYIGVGLPVENISDQQQLWWVASSAMLYYLWRNNFDMGAVFTASHNPPEYVGMKVINNQWLLVPSWDLKAMVTDYLQVGEIDEDDMQRIREKAMGPENALISKVDESVETLSWMLAQKFWWLEKSVKIVVDYSNWAAIWYEKSFLEALWMSDQFTFIHRDDKADSTFSSHESDTTNPHDYKKLMKAVVDESADFGVMFDGDGDRLWFVNNKGEFVSGDLMVAIQAKNILRNAEPGRAVVYDVTSTNTIPEVITQMWWVPIPSRVGHRYIKEKMVEHDAIYGGELSGHLFFPEVGSIEFPLLALYYTLAEMDEYESFDQMVSEICQYYKPPLVNYKVTDKEAVLENIKKAYAEYDQDYTDGVRVNFADGWFLVRPSNTEPKMRMYAEASTKELCEQRVKELEKYLV